MLTFLQNFVSEAYLVNFSAAKSREVSSNGNVYDFSFDYNSIDKSDILNIQKYFVMKNKINNAQPLVLVVFSN